jgi:hypothetical protein
MNNINKWIVTSLVVLINGCASSQLKEEQISEFSKKVLELTTKQDVYGHAAEFVFSPFSDSSDIKSREDYVIVHIKNQRQGKFDPTPLKDQCEYHQYKWESWNKWLFCSVDGDVKFANHRYKDKVHSSIFYKADTFVPIKGKYSKSLANMYSEFKTGYNADLARKEIGEERLKKYQQKFLDMLVRTRVGNGNFAVGRKVCIYNDQSEVIVGNIEQVGQDNQKFKPQYTHDFFLLSGVIPESRRALDFTPRWVENLSFNHCPEGV